MDLNFNNNKNTSCTPFQYLANTNQQYVTPNYYVVYQNPIFPNPQIFDIYDTQINPQIFQYLQDQSQGSFIQNNLQINNIQLPQSHYYSSDFKLNFSTSLEKSNQSFYQHSPAPAKLKDLANYKNLLNNELVIDPKYQNQPMNQNSQLIDINRNLEKSLHSQSQGKLSKFQNPDNTFQNLFQDNLLNFQYAQVQQFNHNNQVKNENIIESKQKNNSQIYQQCGLTFDQNQKINSKITQKMEIENQIKQCSESTQIQQAEFTNCLSLKVKSHSSINNEQILQKKNKLKKGSNYLNSSLDMISINQPNQKQCKYKSTQDKSLKQISIKRDNQFTQHCNNLNLSQQQTEIIINSETKLELDKSIISLNKKQTLDSLQIKNSQPQQIVSHLQQYSIQKNQVQKINNKIKIKQEKILNKLINAQPIKEESIIQQYNVQDAFDIIKKSIFNQQKELIFEQKLSHSFKLKFSNIKNNEIVFASIKESRRNNRYQNKNNSGLNPINLNKNINQQIEDSVKQVSQSEENYKSNSSNDSLKNYDGFSQTNKSLNKKSKAPSKFHNLKKLFMYKLVATFNLSNMIEIGVPEILREILLKLIVRFKISAKKSEEFNRKTEFFSQAHYNALFLYLNQHTINQLAKSNFEVYLHKIIYQIDIQQIAENLQKKQKLNNQKKIQTSIGPQKQIDSIIIEEEEDIFEERIQYINIIKRYCYQIVKSSNMFGVNSQKQQPIDDLNIPSQSQEFKQFNEQENMRMAYTYRALQGISNLSKGIFIKKF